MFIYYLELILLQSSISSALKLINYMEDKKNRNFPKMAKIGSITFKKHVDIMKLCHGILFIFH